jgi:hypothetical protein
VFLGRIPSGFTLVGDVPLWHVRAIKKPPLEVTVPGAELPTVLALDREQLVALVAAMLVEAEVVGGSRPTSKQITNATEDALELVKAAKALVKNEG